MSGEPIPLLSRLVPTRQGWLEIRFAPSRVLSLVHVTAFGQDGWALRKGHWDPLDGEASLAEAMVSVGGLPASEARRIAAETLDGWRRRERSPGGQGGRARRLYDSALLTVLVAIPVVVLAVLGVGIWLLVRAV